MEGREFIEILCENTTGKQNVSELARMTGVSSYVFSCIKNGQQSCKLKPEYADLITQVFTHINKMWLLDPDNTENILAENAPEGLSPAARVEELAHYLGMSKMQMEDYFKVSRGVFYNIGGRVKNISPTLMRTIVAVRKEINPSWLASGSGDMLLYEPEELPTSPVPEDAEPSPRPTSGVMDFVESIRNERLSLEATIKEARSIVDDMQNILDQLHESLEQAKLLRGSAVSLITEISKLNSNDYSTGMVAEDLPVRPSRQ